ncbi:hypothetical protein FQA39_LY14670 [Lamprigera yunnana]|nr:hypothetical protein FQA39_LY14670 [Lamprigera yunnana]
MHFKLERLFFPLSVCIVVCSKFNVLSETVTTPNLTNIEEIFVDDYDNHTWTSPNFPEPYPKECHTLIVKAELGYSIFITIEELDLDSEKGDFLMVKAGSTYAAPDSGKIFTYTLKNPKTYVTDQNNAYISFRVLGNNEAKKKGFSIVYKRIGEVITTEAPTTEITWPTPGGTDHIYCTVNVSGKSQDDFRNDSVMTDFKNTVAEMGMQFCTDKNISLRENITNANVHIQKLIRCPYYWPYSETCVTIRFSLPVFLLETNTSEYQLSAPNLMLMWDLYSDKFLNKYSMSSYVKLENSSNLLVWVVVSILVIIIFIILLLVVKVIGQRISTPKIFNRKNSDTQGIVDNEMRASKLSLSPHPLQITPPFFDNDYSFSQYEPNIRMPSRRFDPGD